MNHHFYLISWFIFWLLQTAELIANPFVKITLLNSSWPETHSWREFSLISSFFICWTNDSSMSSFFVGNTYENCGKMNIPFNETLSCVNRINPKAKIFARKFLLQGYSFTEMILLKALKVKAYLPSILIWFLSNDLQIREKHSSSFYNDVLNF